MTHLELYKRGVKRVEQFCERNCLHCPRFRRLEKHHWPWDACDFYRDGKITICLERCAHVAGCGPMFTTSSAMCFAQRLK